MFRAQRWPSLSCSPNGDGGMQPGGSMVTVCSYIVNVELLLSSLSTRPLVVNSSKPGNIWLDSFQNKNDWELIEIVDVFLSTGIIISPCVNSICIALNIYCQFVLPDQVKFFPTTWRWKWMLISLASFGLSNWAHLIGMVRINTVTYLLHLEQNWNWWSHRAHSKVSIIHYLSL